MKRKLDKSRLGKVIKVVVFTLSGLGILIGTIFFLYFSSKIKDCISYSYPLKFSQEAYDSGGKGAFSGYVNDTSAKPTVNINKYCDFQIKASQKKAIAIILSSIFSPIILMLLVFSGKKLYNYIYPKR